MRAGQRRPEPAPGDLYLDPAVPREERVTVSHGGWTAQATHVWLGSGWVRLAGTGAAVPVRPVPASAPV